MNVNEGVGAAAVIEDGLNAAAGAASAIIENIDPPQTASAFSVFVKSLWGKLTTGKVLSSLIVLLVCLLLVRAATALLHKILNRMSLDVRVKRYAVQGVKTLLYLLTVMIVAGSLGIDMSSLIAIVSVFGLAVSFAVQDTLSNIAGGIVMLFAKPFALGDYVETDDGEGTVAAIGLTHTCMDTYAGQRVMLPNSKLSAGKIVNYTVLGIRRADHAIGVSYDCDPAAVKAACLKAVARTPNILAEPAPQAVITAYRDSAVEYHVRFWAKTADFWDANFASLENIYRVFAEDGVKITYNHINVHIVDPKNTKEK
ncbi:MAG: mechanosensitive ion channel family protein [Oscillospiraceae bacterium]|nr:mechanosensitive ion channel family protein [Oscillospiraceae bacterium]